MWLWLSRYLRYVIMFWLVKSVIQVQITCYLIKTLIQDICNSVFSSQIQSRFAIYLS